MDYLEITEDASIVIEDNSTSTILVKPKKDITLELKIGKNCKVSSFLIQEHDVSIVQKNCIGEMSVVHSNCLWLNEGKGKVCNILEGRKAEAYDLHIFVGKRDNRLHLDTLLRHVAEETKGNVLVKGIADNKAIANLDGMIKVDETGDGADSMLSEHVMLLSEEAHATANPGLEIKNNNVSSTHAASVSPIDEEKIFYLTSRGLSRENAKRLVVEGFLESGVDRIQNEEFRRLFLEKIRTHVEAHTSSGKTAQKE